MDLVNVDPPRPGEGEVLVKVQYAGVCGTDIHILQDLYPKAIPPVTMGHEFSGIVSEPGPNVEGWTVGDRVTVESVAEFCGVCEFCRSGQTQRCEKRLGFGSGRDGAFASFVVTRQDGLYRLPDHVSFQEGALCEPLACAIHAVMERSSVEPGKKVLVTGPGPIGLLVLQVAKAAGATVVISGTQRDEERLKLAKRMGADHCAQIDQQDLNSPIHELTGGMGVDVSFECSGAFGAVKDCLREVRKGGEIVQVGLFGNPIQLNYDDVTFKEIQVKGSFTHNRKTWEKAIELLRDRKVNVAPLVSREFPLDQWDEAFRLFERGEGLKYLLYPID
ncbi:MAG: zinc-binding dehydrogenase [Proteobacteria bacterium]|nr:zinc-binding dehydrogenase [Pseudomonadota bacterium]